MMSVFLRDVCEGPGGAGGDDKAAVEGHSGAVDGIGMGVVDAPDGVRWGYMRCRDDIFVELFGISRIFNPLLT